MAKHIRIVGKTMDELDGGKNGVTLVWKKLEDCAMLAANDHTVVHKCDRRRRIVTANRRRPESSPVTNIPEGKGGVVENCGNSGMTNVELEGNEGLWNNISFNA
jgi:hypothetical protein